MTGLRRIAAALAACGLTGVACAAEGAGVIHAKDFGWNPTNATEALQKAIDSGAATVMVDDMGSPWYVGTIRLRSDLTIRLAKGVRIHTFLPEWEQNKKRSMFLLEKGIANFTLEGSGIGESLVGSFETREQRLKYCRPGQEWQTGVYIGSGATNIVVRNLSLAHCGCDGLSVGGWRIPSHNVLVEDVDMWDNHRQACSPMVADGLTFRRCKFRDTNGTEPSAGADMEPCYDVHPLQGVLFEDCEFGNNNGGGLITPMSSIFPIDVTVRRCTFHPEKGRSPIDILARGDTYMNRLTPADVRLVFEDCTVESYGNDPAINFATGPIFTCVFRNVTIREVPGCSVWRPARKCSPVEFRLDRDYHGAFPPAKCGKVVFENVTATGYEGRPFIQFVDTLGKQDVIGYFSGVVTFNGEKVDTATFNHKAMDARETPCRRIPVKDLKNDSASPIPDPSNCRLVPWGDWYEHAPCYSYYFHAKAGDQVGFSVVYPQKTDFVDFAKKLKGIHQMLETPAGPIDLGELKTLTNRFELTVKATGWHAFFPPFQDGEGNYVRVENVVGTRLAYQADSVESGELKFVLRDPAKDYVGYFEVPPGVDCRLRVSRGTVELRDPSGRTVDRAVENEYAGRKVFAFRASGDRPEVWSFRTPPGNGTRVMRFYAPLNGIWADGPAILPRVRERVVHAKDFGWNATNATAAVQAAIDSDATTVVLDAMPEPWHLDQVTMKSDKRIVFKKGVTVLRNLASPRLHKEPKVLVRQTENVVFEGEGTNETYVGCYATHEERLEKCKWNGKRVFSLDRATNTVIRGLTVADSEEDGVVFGGDLRHPSVNTRLEDLVLARHYRQACSICNAKGVYCQNVTFAETLGNEPGAGVDVEPVYPCATTDDLWFESCTFDNNHGGGLVLSTCSDRPIRCHVRDCRFTPSLNPPVQILARGEAYVPKHRKADVIIEMSGCAIDSYVNLPAIQYVSAPLFTCSFENLTLTTNGKYSPWRPHVGCPAVEFLLSRDYDRDGGFDNEKMTALSTFRNVMSTGRRGPFLGYRDTMGKQDVLKAFAGIVTHNGKEVDLSKLDYVAPDRKELPCELARARAFAAPTADPNAENEGNADLSVHCAWYQHLPEYAYLFHARKGQSVSFALAYPRKLVYKDMTKELKGVHLELDTPSGKVDLGELEAGTNRFSYVAGRTGWHVFRPPLQDGEGNHVRLFDVKGARMAYQADTTEDGNARLALRDPAKDYVGYFEVPPHVLCHIRVTGGDFELRDPEGKVVGAAEREKYHFRGRWDLRFRAKGDKPEIWSFRLPPGREQRTFRFYRPLSGVWADTPALLPRTTGEMTDEELDDVDVGLKAVGRLQTRALPQGWKGDPSDAGRTLAAALTVGPGPFGADCALRAHLALPGIRPDTRCDAQKTGTYEMRVSCFKRRGKSVRFYWFANGRPDNRGGFDTVTLYLPEQLEHPIWADALTGRVCEIPEKNVRMSGKTCVIGGVPVRDTPVVVCDRGALPLEGETEEAWTPPAPQDIVLYSGEPLRWADDSVTLSGNWDLTQNRTIRIDLENTCTNGGTRIAILDQGSGRSSAWIPAGFNGTVDIDLLAPLAHPELRGMIKGMQSDPFYRPTFGWTPEPQLFNVRDLKLERYVLGKGDAPGGKLPELTVRKVTALDTSKKPWPAWFAMDEKEFFPFVDRYGQFKHKEWPSKTHSDREMQERAKAEIADLAAHPGPADRDKFGGWTKGPKLEATGRFRLEKVDGKWWFVDPEGRLWWSHGIVRVTPSSAVTPLDGRERYFAWLPKKGDAADPFEAFYRSHDELLKPYYDKRNIRETFDFSAANLLRKYGADWRRTYEELSHRRLRSWGFNTIANSSDRTIRRMCRTPFVERLETRGPRCKEQRNEGLWWHVPDPYSPEFRANLREQLEANREELTSPWCLGLFVDNEHNWTGISEKTMREYFKVIREEIKRLDPQLLYFGCRFANRNETVVRTCAEFSDALSYNIYAARLDHFRLPKGLDKPVLVGEFHFGSIADTGLFKPSLVWCPDQKRRAEAYLKYVGDALDHPNFVGVHWHQFSDQATTGRFDGENANTGFTDVCDTPYAEMVEAVRKVGETMYERRRGR